MAVTQSHFRFGLNEGTESTHGWYAAEDVSPAPGKIPVDQTFLLRFCLQCDGTLQSNIDAEFQYRKNGGAWTQITQSTADVKAVVTSVFADAAHTTQRLSGTGTFETTSTGCTHDGISGGTAFDIVANGNGETMCSLQMVGRDLRDGDRLEFRLTRDGGVLIDTYAVTPAISVVLVSRPRVVTGPFPFPKETPAFGIASNDVTVALSGVAATAAIGVLTAALTLGLVGEGGTAAAGTLATDTAVALTGVEGTGSPGTLTPSSEGTAALTGVQGTAELGSLAAVGPVYVSRPRIVTGPFPFPKETPAFPISSPDRTVLLSGVEATGAIGSMGVAGALVDRPHRLDGPFPFLTGGMFQFRSRNPPVVPATTRLTGVQGTGAPGTLGPAVTVTLTGVTGTGATGSLGIAQGLAGVSAAGSINSLASTSVTVGLSGVGATGSVGSVGAIVGQGAALTGVQAAGAAGTMAVPPIIEVTLTGVVATTATGTLVVFVPPLPFPAEPHVIIDVRPVVGIIDVRPNVQIIEVR